jgi:hypothetical protein
VSKPELKLDWCSHEAAKYACEKWHYARRYSRQPNHAYLGVWESGQFVGCLCFNRGANNNMAKPYGLSMFQCCELARVALRAHGTPVSRLVAIALRLIKRTFPGLRLVVSYADPEHGHHGGIYQAGNWLYAGLTDAAEEYVINGRKFQGRALRATRRSHPRGRLQCPNVLSWARQVLDPSAHAVRGVRKHRYLYPLDPEMRARIAPLARPYPKRAAGVAGDTPPHHGGEGGSTPTAALSDPGGP